MHALQECSQKRPPAYSWDHQDETSNKRHESINASTPTLNASYSQSRQHIDNTPDTAMLSSKTTAATDEPEWDHSLKHITSYFAPSASRGMRAMLSHHGEDECETTRRSFPDAEPPYAVSSTTVPSATRSLRRPALEEPPSPFAPSQISANGVSRDASHGTQRTEVCHYANTMSKLTRTKSSTPLPEPRYRHRQKEPQALLAQKALFVGEQSSGPTIGERVQLEVDASAPTSAPTSAPYMSTSTRAPTRIPTPIIMSTTTSSLMSATRDDGTDNAQPLGQDTMTTPLSSNEDKRPTTDLIDLTASLTSAPTSGSTGIDSSIKFEAGDDDTSKVITVIDLTTSSAPVPESRTEAHPPNIPSRQHSDQTSVQTSNVHLDIVENRRPRKKITHWESGSLDVSTIREVTRQIEQRIQSLGIQKLAFTLITSQAERK